MSTVNQLVEQIKLSTDFQLNKKRLKEKILTDLHIPYNNGLFLVDRSLIAFLNSWEDETIYIEDVYQNPIEVNRIELLALAKQHYQTVMNQWHHEYSELRRVRKI